MESFLYVHKATLSPLFVENEPYLNGKVQYFDEKRPDLIKTGN